jgi:hypothetical protein
MQVVLGNIVGGILGIGLGLVFVIPNLVMTFGLGLGAAGKIPDSIIG